MGFHSLVTSRRRERETEVMLRILVICALVAAVSSEADPQYFINPYYTPYQPVVSYYPQSASYPQFQQVVPSSYAEPKEDKTSELKPTLYTAEPGYLTQIPQGSGKYLPDLFGWERGPDYFKKWNNVPVQIRNNRVRWRTDGQRMANGFNSASGADPNKYTTSIPIPAPIRAGRRGRLNRSSTLSAPTPTPSPSTRQWLHRYRLFHLTPPPCTLPTPVS